MRLIHTSITLTASHRLRSQRDLLDKMVHRGPWLAAQSLTQSTLGAPLVQNSPTCSTIRHQPLCHHRFHCKGRISSTHNSSNWNYNNKNSLSSLQIQAIRLSFQTFTLSSRNRSLISIPLARPTHSNLEAKEFEARSQISSSSNPSSAWPELAKS